MPHRPLLLALGPGVAQSIGSWNVDSEFDLYSDGCLGSVWTAAQRHPTDVTATDALLVVGCDPAAQVGVEIAAWVAPFEADTLGAADAQGESGVIVQDRFDQGPVLRQTWFLFEGHYQVEAVAYHDLNEALLAGLSAASTMALRIESDADRRIQERTKEFDLRGFSNALDSLRRGAIEDHGPGPAPEPFADASDDAPMDEVVRVGDWSFAGDVGMPARADRGAVAVYCADDGSGIEIEVGDFALTAPAYEVRFRSGTIDFLQATATLDAYGAARLAGADLEDRLVRFLSGVIDLALTIHPASGGEPTLSYTVPTLGFGDALARLGCYLGGR